MSFHHLLFILWYNYFRTVIQMKINRNDPCWCKSGKKYKFCHMSFDERLAVFERKGYVIPTHKMIKNEAQIEGIREAGIINTGLLDYISLNIKEGLSTDDINEMVNEFTYSHGAIPADLNYEGYPKSVCTSINDVICHGIPNKKDILKKGDIINVDVTTKYKDYFADASRMYMIGDVTKEAEKLVSVTKECLELGIASIKPFESTIGDIGKAISKHAHDNGFSVVEEYCGHGVGLAIHEDPYVFHFDPNYKTELIVPGMVFTIEPMINEGLKGVRIDYSDGWTARTKDHKLSAQVEHTLLVTEDGVEILSK